MLIRGIKKGKIIELLEEVDWPDNQEITLEIRGGDNFWSVDQKFRHKMQQEEIVFEENDFANWRDRSPGREVNL